MTGAILVDMGLVDDRCLVLFDDGAGRWGPMTDLRASFDLRTGAVSNRLRIERALGRTAQALLVPEPWRDLYRNGAPTFYPSDKNGLVLTVHGRWRALDGLDAVAALEPGDALVQPDGQLVAALLRSPLGDLTHDGHALLSKASRRTATAAPVLMERPWDVIVDLERALLADLEASAVPPIDSGTTRAHTTGDAPIRVAEDAKLHPMVVLNAEKGPVVIDRGAIVGSFAVVAGPAYVGPGAIVTPHTHLRSNTVIGPSCVVGGEISHSILAGHSNKAHAGYLGHSLVGRWVNLGADTTGSNLKNTYGEVRVPLDAEEAPQPTGTNKFGAIIGDHVRTAIGTRLTTGSCIGTGSMVALSSFAPAHVPRFSFWTDRGRDHCDFERFLATSERMMARRNQVLTEAERARLRTLSTRVRSNK